MGEEQRRSEERARRSEAAFQRLAVNVSDLLTPVPYSNTFTSEEKIRHAQLIIVGGEQIVRKAKADLTAR